MKTSNIQRAIDAFCKPWTDNIFNYNVHVAIALNRDYECLHDGVFNRYSLNTHQFTQTSSCYENVIYCPPSVRDRFYKAVFENPFLSLITKKS